MNMTTATRFETGDRVRFLENGIQVPPGTTGTVVETFYDSADVAEVYGGDAPLFVELDGWEFPDGNLFIPDNWAAAVSSEVERLEGGE